MKAIRKRGGIPTAAMAVGLLAAGGVAAGVYTMKKKRDTEKKVEAMRASNYRNRGAYRSIRTPGYAYITDGQVEFYGNKHTRYRMMKNAKHRLNNVFAYRSSIWDLERFLR